MSAGSAQVIAGSRLVNVDRRRGRGRRVIRRVGRREGDRERLAVSRIEHRPRGRGVGERAGYRRGCIELGGGQLRAEGDVGGIGPGNGGRSSSTLIVVVAVAVV